MVEITYPDPSQFPEAEDFVPDDEDAEDTDTKGVGGIINSPRETWPQGWSYVEGESSPPVSDLGRQNVEALRAEGLI